MGLTAKDLSVLALQSFLIQFVTLRLHNFNRCYGMLEDQKLSFCCLEKEFVGVVALEGPGDWLAS
jgi:hypothetical protein